MSVINILVIFAVDSLDNEMNFYNDNKLIYYCTRARSEWAHDGTHKQTRPVMFTYLLWRFSYEIIGKC